MSPEECPGSVMARRTLHHDVRMERNQPLFRVAKRKLSSASRGPCVDKKATTYLESVGVVRFDTSLYTITKILTPSSAFLLSSWSTR